MREEDVQKACADRAGATCQAQDQERAALSRYQPTAQEMVVAARTEWFRQMRLQSAVFAMQLNVRGGTPTGETVVADAEQIFAFLTKEDVN